MINYVEVSYSEVLKKKYLKECTLCVIKIHSFFRDFLALIQEASLPQSSAKTKIFA